MSRHPDPANARARYDQYVTNYAADLYRYGYWLCTNRDSTGRLVMKAYQRAWLVNVHSGNVRLSKEWFFAALHNEFYGEHAAYESPTDNDELIAPVVNDTVNDHITRLDSLRYAIGKMPVEYRETLILHELFDIGCAEIGKICDISEAAVLTRLLHAKQNILSDLGQNRGRDANTRHNTLL